MKLYRIEPPKHLRDFLPESKLQAKDVWKVDHNSRAPNRLGLFIGMLQRSANTPIKLSKEGIAAMGVDSMSFDMTDPTNADLLAALKVSDEMSFSKLFSGKKPLKGTDGKMYSLAYLEKTADMGSSKGSGAGAAQTTSQEVGQAIVCAVYSSTPSLTAAKLLADAAKPGAPLINKALNKVSATSIGTELPKIAALLQADPSWAEAFVSTAAVINSDDKGIPLSGKTFHHRSPMTDAIKTAFAAANGGGKAKKGAPKKAKTFTDINKWNPADIWITSSANQVISELKDPANSIDLNALNAWMAQAYSTRLLVGVSLKKPESGAPKLSLLNDDQSHQKLKIMIDELIVKKGMSSSNLETVMGTEKNDKSGSKDAHIGYKSESINPPLSLFYMMNEDGPGSVQIRSFGDKQDVQGEVKGKAASHGKVGFYTLKSIIAERTGYELTPYTNVINKVKNSRWEAVSEITERAAAVVGGTSNDDTVKAVMANVKGRTNDYIASKYQAVELVWVVDQYRRKVGKKANDLINAVYQYATSTTPLSSVFVKVS